MMAEALVEVVDLEKDLMAVGVERAKVVLLVRIVGVTKVVKDGDGLDDSGDGLIAKGGDTRSHDRESLGKILAQRVVQCANAHSLGIHDSAPDFRWKGSDGKR